MTSQIVMNFVVRSCERRKRLVSAQKLADDSVQSVFEDIGFYLTLDPGGLSFFIGFEEPGLRPGQRLRLRLEPL